jgi:hypothetical protein
MVESVEYPKNSRVASYQYGRELMNAGSQRKHNVFIVYFISEKNYSNEGVEVLILAPDSTVYDVITAAGIATPSDYYIRSKNNSLFISDSKGGELAEANIYYVQKKLKTGVRSIRAQVQDENDNVESHIVLQLNEGTTVTIRDIFNALSNIQMTGTQTNDYICKRRQVHKHNGTEYFRDDVKPIVCNLSDNIDSFVEAGQEWIVIFQRIKKEGKGDESDDVELVHNHSVGMDLASSARDASFASSTSISRRAGTDLGKLRFILRETVPKLDEIRAYCEKVKHRYLLSGAVYNDDEDDIRSGIIADLREWFTTSKSGLMELDSICVGIKASVEYKGGDIMGRYNHIKDIRFKMQKRLAHPDPLIHAVLPYFMLEPICFPDGITRDNWTKFFLDTQYGKIDLEELDGTWDPPSEYRIIEILPHIGGNPGVVKRCRDGNIKITFGGANILFEREEWANRTGVNRDLTTTFLPTRHIHVENANAIRFYDSTPLRIQSSQGGIDKPQIHEKIDDDQNNMVVTAPFHSTVQLMDPNVMDNVYAKTLAIALCDGVVYTLWYKTSAKKPYISINDFEIHLKLDRDQRFMCPQFMVMRLGNDDLLCILHIIFLNENGTPDGKWNFIAVRLTKANGTWDAARRAHIEGPIGAVDQSGVNPIIRCFDATVVNETVEIAVYVHTPLSGNKKVHDVVQWIRIPVSQIDEPHSNWTTGWQRTIQVPRTESQDMCTVSSLHHMLLHFERNTTDGPPPLMVVYGGGLVRATWNLDPSKDP